MGLFKKDDKPESHFSIPRLPVSPLLDILTGTLMRCRKGDFVVNGGLCPHMAITGKGNSNKTLIMISFIGTYLSRISHVNIVDIDAQIYETENTLEYMRCMQLILGVAKNQGLTTEELENLELWLSEHFILRSSAKLEGNAFYDEMNELCDERVKKNKDKIVLPFNDIRGKPVEMFVPHLCGIDSFSAFEPTIVADKFIHENTAGHKDNNTMYLKEAGAKTQMLQKWLNQNARASIYMFSSAHMGETMSLNPQSPPEKKIAFMKQTHKLKNVPEKYYFYVSCMLFVNGAVPLVNADRIPLYPFNSEDKEKRDNKDILLETMILRNKHGQSGVIIPLIANQNTGIEWSLSEFHYIKENNRFGLDGNNTSYHLDLIPDVNLGRTTVRGKLIDNAKLRRAVQITCELHLMYRYMFDKIPKELRCTPKELFDGLKAQGYDWDFILESTRGYYTIDHYEHPVPPISAYDLLRMRVGQYIPYWMDEKDIPQGAKDLRDGVNHQKAA